MRPSPRCHEVRISGHQRHRFGGNAEPFAHQLHKARLVALAGRKRANRHGHGLVKQDLERGSLVGRTACRLDVAPDADAAIEALRPRGCAPRLEAVPIGKGYGLIEDLFIEAAVIGHTEWIYVWQSLGGNEVHATQSKAVETARLRRPINEPLHYKHDLRSTGAAIGYCRRRI